MNFTSIKLEDLKYISNIATGVIKEVDHIELNFDRPSNAHCKDGDVIYLMKATNQYRFHPSEESAALYLLQEYEDELYRDFLDEGDLTQKQKDRAAWLRENLNRLGNIAY